MSTKKVKCARFQVDQVSDYEEDVIMNDEYVLTTKSESNPCTLYRKSLRHYLTREVLPTESNYRNLLSFGRSSIRKQLRPTMHELRDEDVIKPLEVDEPQATVNCKKKGKVVKLGWINGVYVSFYCSHQHFTNVCFLDALSSQYLGCDAFLEADLGHGPVWYR